MTAGQLGAWGEQQAEEYLLKKGYRLLKRRYRCRFGEIDLVMKLGEITVFVEVKTRSDVRFGLPREYVTGSKQRKLTMAAMKWIESCGEEVQPRFDVVEVYASNPSSGKTDRIVHLENVF